MPILTKKISLNKWRNARDKTAKDINYYNYLLIDVANDILSRITELQKKIEFKNILLIGADQEVAGIFTQNYPDSILNYMDISTYRLQETQSENIFQLDKIEDITVKFDLIVDILFLHNIPVPPDYVKSLKNMLNEKGSVFSASFGPKTLMELKSVMYDTELAYQQGVAIHIPYFESMQEYAMLFKNTNFTQIISDSYIIKIEYDDMKHLIKEIRGMGEGNFIVDEEIHMVPLEIYKKMIELYSKNFLSNISENQGIEKNIYASFEIIITAAW